MKTKKRWKITGWGEVVVMLLLTLALSATAVQAAPLNFILQTSPNMFSDAIDVRYDSASQTLTATGFAEHIDNGTDTPTPVVNGSFAITAQISNTGAVLSGNLTVTGEVPSLGISQGPLLVGNLTALGYGEAGSATEFQFDTTDGALFYSFGPVIRVILGQSGFAGNFTEDFSNGAIGVAGIGW